MSAPRPASPSTADAVGLLQPQLLGAAHDGLALCVRAEQRNERQLVDREQDLLRVDDRPLERRRGVELPSGSASGCAPGSSSSPTITAPSAPRSGRSLCASN